MIAMQMSSVEKFWRGFLTGIGRLDIGDDPRFKDRAGRVANSQALIQTLRPILATKPSTYWVNQISDQEVPCAPVRYHSGSARRSGSETPRAVPRSRTPAVWKNDGDAQIGEAGWRTREQTFTTARPRRAYRQGASRVRPLGRRDCRIAYRRNHLTRLPGTKTAAFYCSRREPRS